MVYKMSSRIAKAVTEKTFLRNPVTHPTYCNKWRQFILKGLKTLDQVQFY